jgi:pimeloyl-ACP methyl ester carboxylesterase
VVATDYAGMGTAGPDSYLVMDTAAHTVLDSIRAAQAIPEAQAGNRVVLWGHSQGGQAVLAAAQEAPEYAPELDVAAVAAAAPAADLTTLLGSHLDDISGVTISSYAFPAFVDVYGDSVAGVQLDAILTPEAIAANPEMNRLCLLSHLNELHEIGQPLVGDFFLQDPTTTEPWATLLKENSVGAAPIDVPVFIAQGTNDELVLPADTEGFVEQERALGTEVEYLRIPLATHATVAYLAVPALAIWLDEHAGSD